MIGQDVRSAKIPIQCILDRLAVGFYGNKHNLIFNSARCLCKEKMKLNLWFGRKEDRLSVSRRSYQT